MKLLNFRFLLIIAVVVSSCKQTKDTNFTLEGTIKGLKKGTVYLERVQDTLIIAIDSFQVRDDGHFVLGTHLESPEIFYFRIKEIPDKKLLIFGEKTSVNLEAKLSNFDYVSTVTGSKNHDLLMTYKEMIQKFKNAKLDLFKADIEAKKANRVHVLDSLELAFQKMNRRQYLYTTNFAVNNSDFEVAPYIALTELFNAKLHLLDTVNNSLSEEIKNSKYGKQLDRFITVIKKNEGVVSNLE